MRIYVVNHGDKRRLVQANTPRQAIAHVAKGLIHAYPAKPIDVATAMQAGAELESAVEEVDADGC